VLNINVESAFKRVYFITKDEWVLTYSSLAI